MMNLMMSRAGGLYQINQLEARQCCNAESIDGTLLDRKPCHPRCRERDPIRKLIFYGNGSYTRYVESFGYTITDHGQPGAVGLRSHYGFVVDNGGLKLNIMWFHYNFLRIKEIGEDAWGLLAT